MRIAESRGEQTGVNLLFVYKQGPILPDTTYYCGHDGCALDVYVDNGTGYKQAVGIHYTGTDIHVSRANGQVTLFIEDPPIAFSTGGCSTGAQLEWVLNGDSFRSERRPRPSDIRLRRPSP